MNENNQDDVNNIDEYLKKVSNDLQNNSFGEDKIDNDNLNIVKQYFETQGNSSNDKDIYEINPISPDEIVQKNNNNKKSFFINSIIYSFLLVFGITFISFNFIFNYYFIPIKVVGISMQPTINVSTEMNGYYESNSDTVHCDIAYYKKDNFYNNNDIVIISNENGQYVSNSSQSTSKVSNLIKRVIATEGQTVKFIKTDEKSNGDSTTYYYNVEVYDKNGNNINLDQSYLSSDPMYFTYSSRYLFYSYNEYPIFRRIFSTLVETGESSYTVSDNCYFVMGDNRNYSNDSRFFGEVKYDDIEGSVKFIVQYNSTIIQTFIKKIKSYF